ncbi:018d7d51-946b-47ca-b38e-41bb42f0dc64 [Thermothielavioides terrestris]|uniref:018d7d51-946b-47ca-b38e-41bb42f0dc64 n=1 Tax=Thermothielavioides terrestris TaxID=2587410 RepID=A0A446B6U3_9PEZI|nr:018d7d51-946b-47ca-b38e-41bb42f0dc64 [Thermothielavioides terrestris]
MSDPQLSPPKEGATAAATAAAKSTSRRPSLLLIAGGLVTFVVVALALGLGLGLGLTHRGGSSASSLLPPASSSSPLPGSGAAPNASLEDWRLDPSHYVLDMAWDINAPPTTRHYDFVITEGRGWPDGVVRDMLFINGKFPGPLIEANMGDRLVINVTNKLAANATTIHWHGLYQNGTNWFDGTTGITQCGIPPGQSLVYNFTLEQFGTYWYHSHYSTQYLDGILGPLIIHAPAEADARKLYDNDRVVLIQDWYHDVSQVNLETYLAPDNENTEPIPDNGLINGIGYFNCSSYDADSGYTCYDNSTYSVLSLEPNTRTRLRFINTGAFTEFDVSIDNHTLSVIEADATLVKPVTVHRFPIHVAQRYSVVVETNQSTSTNYWLRGAMITSCFTGNNPVLDTTTKAVISYSGNSTVVPSDDASVDWTDAIPIHCIDLDASTLVPTIPDPPPAATKMWRLDFSFGIGAYQLDRAKFNGTSWSVLDNTTTLIQAVDGLAAGQAQGSSTSSSSSSASKWAVDGPVGAFGSNQFVVGLSANGSIDVVDILLYSLDEGSHPFHLHGHTFWILQTGSGPFNWTAYQTTLYPAGGAASSLTANALRRDTFTLQPYAWTLLRFVADNAGLWAFHCHIAWHLEAGLMMQFLSRPDVLARTAVPDDKLDIS